MILPTFASALALLIVFNASPVSAQSTFADLASKVRVGEQLIVTDHQGTVTKGKVLPPRTLFRATSTRKTVSLVPIVGPDRRGFAASFRF